MRLRFFVDRSSPSVATWIDGAAEEVEEAGAGAAGGAGWPRKAESMRK